MVINTLECVSAYKHVFIDTHTHTDRHRHTQTSTHTHTKTNTSSTHTHTQACMHAQTCTHTHTHTHTHTRTHTHTHTHTHTLVATVSKSQIQNFPVISNRKYCSAPVFLPAVKTKEWSNWHKDPNAPQHRLNCCTNTRTGCLFTNQLL